MGTGRNKFLGEYRPQETNNNQGDMTGVRPGYDRNPMPGLNRSNRNMQQSPMNRPGSFDAQQGSAPFLGNQQMASGGNSMWDNLRMISQIVDQGRRPGYNPAGGNQNQARSDFFTNSNPSNRNMQNQQAPLNRRTMPTQQGGGKQPSIIDAIMDAWNRG